MKLQPKIRELLNQRGITGEAELLEFLSEKPQKTYDPFLLLNMEAGVDLILSAIEDEKKICIYGDYDADGITSTAVLMEVLSHLTHRLVYYIPSRFEEGYGLNCGALDKIKDSGVDLVVTVDCGSVSFDEVEYAREIGLEIMVTDHHTTMDQVPNCIVINPLQPGCPYPFKYLAGVGVAFKLAQAIASEAGLPKSIVNRTLDLVGIGTIGDIVPLIDENRTLAKYGLRSINLTQRPGLSRLMEQVSLHRGEVTSENISYIIVPHLNASGRMASAKIAEKLLLEKDETKVQPVVEALIRCNRERKKKQEETYELCKKIVEEKYTDDLFLVIDLEDAHEGITGIVAGKIKDTYGRPAVIVTPTADCCLKGTGRSIEGVNIYQLLRENRELFVRFGGHAAACGFTMPRENLPVLRNNLNGQMRVLLDKQPDLFQRTVCAELALAAEDVCLELAEELQMLSPFGCANPEPLLAVSLRPTGFRKIGSEGQYTKFTGILENGCEIQCVIFKDAREYDTLLKKGQMIRIIGNLHSQRWNGRQYLQMTVARAEELKL